MVLTVAFEMTKNTKLSSSKLEKDHLLQTPCSVPYFIQVSSFAGVLIQTSAYRSTRSNLIDLTCSRSSDLATSLSIPRLDIYETSASAIFVESEACNCLLLYLGFHWDLPPNGQWPWPSLGRHLAVTLAVSRLRSCGPQEHTPARSRPISRGTQH